MNWFPARMPDRFAPPQIERRAPIPVGTVFHYWGRALKVVRVYGDDPAAPVIVEELGEFGTTLRGQYGLWSAAAVASAISARKS